MSERARLLLQRMLRVATAPTPRDRTLAAALVLFVIANLFYHGAQPYAVGAIAAPWDKPAHVLVFFVLGALAWIAFAGRRFWLVLIVCAMVAGADELAQALSPGRDVAIADWLADVTGVALAGVLMAWLRRLAVARVSR
jgi:VanZ family protein